MTFNPDLARERIRFLRARIQDVASNMPTAFGATVATRHLVGEIDWWKRQLAEHRNV